MTLGQIALRAYYRSLNRAVEAEDVAQCDRNSDAMWESMDEAHKKACEASASAAIIAGRML